MNWQDAISGMVNRLVEHERLGVITDMDGTLSPIVANPAEARPTERNRELLQKLSSRLALVAVVSGRAAADVRERVNLPELIYAGNHGLERWQDGEVQVAPAVAPYVPHLQNAIEHLKSSGPQIPGLFIEDKGATVSVHYRNTPDPTTAGEELDPALSAIAAAEGLHMFRGRMVFELRPPLEMHKGTIFRQLIEEYRLDAAVYLGDDTTDADALRVAQQLREQGHCYSFGIGVSSDDMPSVVAESSDVLVPGVEGVESFFSWLLDALSASAI